MRAKRATITVGEISFHYDLQKYKNRFCGNDRKSSINFFFNWMERGKKCKAHELKVVNNKKAAVAADPPISLWVVSFNFQQTWYDFQGSKKRVCMVAIVWAKVGVALYIYWNSTTCYYPSSQLLMELNKLFPYGFSGFLVSNPWRWTFQFLEIWWELNTLCSLSPFIPMIFVFQMVTMFENYQKSLMWFFKYCQCKEEQSFGEINIMKRYFANCKLFEFSRQKLDFF